MNVFSTRLNKWWVDLNAIDEAQAGFRKKCFTIDHAFIFIFLGQKYISKKKRSFLLHAYGFCQGFL